jgi:hypothetical protein
MAELVGSQLALFLDVYGRKPWAPGIDVDCCLFLAEWAIWLGHSDPATYLRGTYNSDDGFRAIIAAHQGVVPLVEHCVAHINGKRVTAPTCGAIGVIGSPTSIHRQWGAIFDGRRWLVRSRAGIAPLAARPLAIWEI